MRNNQGNMVNKWALSVKELFDSLYFSYLFNYEEISVLQINSVSRCIYDQFLQQWFASVNSLFYFYRFESYKLFKTDFVAVKYRSTMSPRLVFVVQLTV